MSTTTTLPVLPSGCRWTLDGDTLEAHDRSGGVYRGADAEAIADRLHRTLAALLSHEDLERLHRADDADALRRFHVRVMSDDGPGVADAINRDPASDVAATVEPALPPGCRLESLGSIGWRVMNLDPGDQAGWGGTPEEAIKAAWESFGAFMSREDYEALVGEAERLRADRDHWRANAESWKVDSAAAHAQLQCARERADRAHRMEREQHEQIQAVRAALVAAGHGAELCGYTPAQVVETLAGRVKAAEQARDRQGEAIKAAHRILDEAGEARSHQRGLAEWALAQRSSMERARKAVDG